MRRCLSILITVGLSVVPASADEVTTCSFGSPTPGSAVARIDLPAGTDFLSIEPRGGRGSPRFGGEQSRHLVQGMFVVNADTLALEAHRVSVTGAGSRRAVVRVDGSTMVDQGLVFADGPFAHAAARPRAGLPPGSYYLIGFGSDGSSAFPNDWWGADVRFGGRHRCVPLGTAGDVFDFDQSHFEGGTQVSLPPAGSGEDLELEFTTARSLVVGVLDAGVQLAGEAELAYEMPSGSGLVEDEIEAFVSVGGGFSFTAEYQGLYPTIVVAGVAVDVPV